MFDSRPDFGRGNHDAHVAVKSKDGGRRVRTFAPPPQASQRPCATSTHLGEEVQDGDHVAIFSRRTKTWQPGFATNITDRNSVEVTYEMDDGSQKVVVKKTVSPFWDGFVGKPSPRRMKLLRLRAEINRPLIVAILGSTKINSFTKSIVEAVAQAITADDSSTRAFCTGGMSGVQEVFAGSVKKSSRKQLYHILPEEGEEEESHLLLGAVADVYIAFEGGPGIAEEADIAYARGAIVIPIPRTQGKSFDSFKCPEPCLQKPDLVDSKLWRCLSDDDVTVSETASAVHKILHLVEDYKTQFSVFAGNLDCVPSSDSW